MKVEELVRSGVEKDAESGKELSTKMKALLSQFDKLSATVDKRIKMAANNVSFQKRVKQVRTSDIILLEITIAISNTRSKR